MPKNKDKYRIQLYLDVDNGDARIFRTMMNNYNAKLIADNKNPISHAEFLRITLKSTQEWKKIKAKTKQELASNKA